MSDTKQFEVITLIELLGIIGAAFLLGGTLAMWILITGAFFVVVVAMSNTYRLKGQKYTSLAIWAETAVLIVICVAAYKGAGVWSLSAIRFFGLLVTLNGLGQRRIK